MEVDVLVDIENGDTITEWEFVLPSFLEYPYTSIDTQDCRTITQGLPSSLPDQNHCIDRFCIFVVYSFQKKTHVCLKTPSKANKPELI